MIVYIYDGLAWNLSNLFSIYIEREYDFKLINIIYYFFIIKTEILKKMKEI